MTTFFRGLAAALMLVPALASALADETRVAEVRADWLARRQATQDVTYVARGESVVAPGR